MSRPARREAARALAPGVLTALAMLAPVLTGARSLFERDLHVLWLEQVRAFARIASTGALPLWDPWASFGRPLAANPNVQVFAPLTWWHVVSSPWTAYTVFVAVHLALCATGCVLLARRAGLVTPAAALAGMAVVVSGPVLSLLNVWNHLGGAAWIPWTLLLALKAVESRAARDAVAWSLATTLQAFEGSPEATVVSLLLAAAVVADRTWGERDARVAVFAAGAAALFAALSAAQWIPAAMLAREAGRTTLPYAVRTTWSLPAERLTELAWPRATTLVDGFLYGLYAGVGIVALAAVGLVAGGPRRARVALVAACGLGLLYALGPAGLVYDVATAVVPPLRSVRYPEKAMVVVGLGVALAAALGLDVVARRFGTRVAWIVAVLVAGEAALQNRGLVSTAPRAFLDEPPPALRALAAQGAQRVFVFEYEEGRAERLLGHPAGHYVNAPGDWSDRLIDAALWRSSLVPPVAGAWGMAGSYERDWVGLGNPHVERLRRLLYEVHGTPAFVRLLRVGGVTHVVARHAVPGLEPVAAVPSFFPEPVRVDRVPEALARVYAVGGARAGDAGVLLAPEFDPVREVVLERGARPAPAGFRADVRVTSFAAQSIAADVTLSHDGWLVVADAWDAGWRATVDGAEAELLRANGAFRAIAVPAGAHNVEMRYRPTPVFVGLGVSAVAAALAAWLLRRDYNRGPGGDFAPVPDPGDQKTT